MAVEEVQGPAAVIYLASPYSDLDPSVEAERYRKACDAVHYLMSLGDIVFSPIVYCHPLACNYLLRKDAVFWQEFDEHMILLSDEVIILQLSGWDVSKGVQSEITFARHHLKPITFMPEGPWQE